MRYVADALDSVAELLHEYDGTTVDGLKGHMWYVDHEETGALIMDSERARKIFKEAWEGWVRAVVVSDGDKMILANGLHDGRNSYMEACLLFVSHLSFYLLVFAKGRRLRGQ